MTPILFLGLMLVLVWFLLIAPQRRRAAAQREAREKVDPGDVILTAGGIYATVLEVRETDLTVQIAEGTTVRLDKRAVAVVVERQDEQEGEPAEDAAEESPAPEPVAAHDPALDEEPSEPART